MNRVEFLDALVRTPSPSGHERKVAELCVSYLKQFSFENAWIDEVGNAVATNYRHEKGMRPDLLLFGHTDTIAVPMEYRRESDRIFGRGAVDAKSPLATLLTAAGEQQVQYKVMVAGVTEEEITTSVGIRHLLEHAKPKMAINGEPSNTNGVTVAYKGRMMVECRTHGKATHAGMKSENPIERTFEYYSRLRAEFPPHKRNFDNVIMNVTHISAGSHETLNVVPETLDFDIDIRIPPSITNSEVANTLRRLAPANVEIKIHESLPGVETSANHPLCRAMVGAIRESGLHPRYVRKSGSADMNITMHAGVPTVAYGPGDSSLDHTPNEFVLIKDYEKAIEIVKRAMVELGKSF
ncbi:MAG: M20/M25/M40 family metallo-hydrolase [Candidatus ainarchaeum sp.]|nr:M20/M25/M40 family metallo-hydrolase [Candidatus ainarchaeum sp.]